MTGDLRQAQLGAMTVSSSTQSPEKLGIDVLCDESRSGEGRNTATADTKSPAAGDHPPRISVTNRSTLYAIQ